MSSPVRSFALSGWRQVAAGVYVLVAEPEAVTIGLIVGSEGALVVDTGSSPDQGRQIRASVSEVTDQPVVGAVATHAHYDHSFGLAAFDDLVTIGHESLRDRLTNPPNREIAVATALDLGGRRVEIAHIGQGHTEGDLVVVVPDADIIFTGDLLESAGPPHFGDDCFPAEWAATLDGVIGLMTERSQAIPGHGEPVNREFVFQQRGEIAGVTGEIRRLVEEGVAEADAFERGSWPYPEEFIRAGIARGYAELAGLAVKGTRPTLPMA